MCGIAGCVGHENAVGFVAEGLTALEYRGYDSAGIAFPESNSPGLGVIKELGSVSRLVAQIPPEASAATTAIGHTRWATHGKPTVENAHPHINNDGTIAVVHNGTIENHEPLRQELRSLGYTFKSETDTEVIPHLFDHYLKEGQEPDEAFTNAVRRLVGAYAILAHFSEDPHTIYAARRGSPLVLGVKGAQRFAASDPRVINLGTRWASFLDDNELAKLSADERYRTWHIEGYKTTRPPKELSDDYEVADKGEFEHFMLKEIYDSPQTVRAAISGRVHPEKEKEGDKIKLGGLQDPEVQEKLEYTNRLAIVGCGTSYHAGLIGERLIEEVAGIPVEVQLASEFQYRQEPIDRDTAVVAITQSGETIDTIGALQKAKDSRLLTLGINNSPGSTIDRITDAGVHCRAGAEVSVASTKAFISQVTVLAELALALGKDNTKTTELRQQLMEELTVLPDKIEQILENAPAIEEAAKKYARYRNFLYIGRGYEYTSAIEGALKLKEISYIHAEGYAAGEMKHGTIALIDEEFPTFAIATNGSVYDKTLSNIEEIKARKGPVIALATEGNDNIKGIADDVLYIPASMEQTQPILNAIALQLFAYYVAVEKGYNVDRPRNLAKSVTVE
jgi:glutamine---fructose-6-phosphate transaminase (isomerizing)